MKTIVKNLKSLFVGLIVGLPIISFASGDISVVEVRDEVEMEKIKVEVPQLFDLDVSITDTEGRILYSETLDKGSKRAIVYNLSKLDDGEYTFLSKAGHQEVTKILEVKDEQLKVVSKEIENKPIFNVKNDMVLINYLNDKNKDIKISLEDNISIYYTKEMGTDIDFRKAIDISKLSRGAYYVVLDIGDDQHTYHFDVF
jgi:hypothetical protein